ncbi:MAG: pilus assembly protein PilM [Desulfobacteraceae bacterium]|nr:pilus assembly protein PilM [Desulfobacteraceae bacterium]
MFRLKPTYPIGIDIGTHDIFAVQIAENRQGVEIRELMHREVQGNDTEMPDVNDALVPLFREISRNKRFLGKTVVAHLPFQHLVSFPVSFQVGDKEDVEQAILRESKDRLPFPVEEAIIDYPSVVSPPNGDGNTYRATIIAIHRDHMNHYLLMLKQAGLVVQAVDFAVSSLIRVHTHLNNPIQTPIILCTIGYSKSLLSIVGQENILAHRTIEWGMGTLLDKIMTNLDFINEKDKAKVLLRQYGLRYEDRENGQNGADPQDKRGADPMGRAIYQIITPSIEELIYELYKIIGYVRSDNQNQAFDCIYFYGHAAMVKQLDRYIENRLNIPTKLMNPMTNMALSEEGILPDISEGAPFALALGLAMRKVPWL